MEAPAIFVKDLTKTFGPGSVAVDRISFTVRRGEIFGFLGPNGAGKTTTIRMLLGLMLPTSGEARVLGLKLPAEAKAVRARAGYMSQRVTLYNELTSVEHLRFYGRAYGLSGSRLRSRLDQVLALARLEGQENELVAHLAGGWRQRLALGCAIIHEPELVFLDEPTAGVDPVSRQELWALIYQLAAQGRTVFVTTHYMDEAELCQRLAFISGGRLVAIDTPERLRSGYMREQVLELACAQPEEAMRALSQLAAAGAIQAREISFYGALLHIVLPDASTGADIIRDCLAAAKIEIQSLQPVTPSIEDVFLAAVDRGLLPGGMP